MNDLQSLQEFAESFCKNEGLTGLKPRQPSEIGNLASELVIAGWQITTIRLLIAIKDAFFDAEPIKLASGIDLRRLTVFGKDYNGNAVAFTIRALTFDGKTTIYCW
ncbi:MAG: hypothetical protein IKA41_04780 [Bacteroidaceae bacterium]|nr:hypothetical protein [Bacteroidaceae bacterium]